VAANQISFSLELSADLCSGKSDYHCTKFKKSVRMSYLMRKFHVFRYVIKIQPILTLARVFQSFQPSFNA
jgi:hypothetical protein